MPDWSTIVAIAGIAERDPKSVHAYFSGRNKSRSTTIRAIERALRTLGLEHLRRAA